MATGKNASQKESPFLSYAIWERDSVFTVVNFWNSNPFRLKKNKRDFLFDRFAYRLPDRRVCDYSKYTYKKDNEC